MRTEMVPITVVTQSANKENIFRDSFADWRIDGKEPTFDEASIQLRAPHDERRPVFISEQKAKEDAAWVSAICGTAAALTGEAQQIPDGKDHIYLYTDTVQFVHEPNGSIMILEKPHMEDPVVWAQTSVEAMAQSGKDIEIVNSLTAIRCSKDGVSEPKTVIVRAHAHMKPYTREDIINYAKGTGQHTMLKDAGGISLANGGRHFYDTASPLIVTVQDAIDAKELELFRFDTWELVPDRVLRPFICGAIEPAVLRVVDKTQLRK